MDLREQLQTTFGNAYTLERELGGGGMSRVFVAEETALGRKVVVKVLPPDLGVSVNVDRFRREIRLAARLQHPHIVAVLSAGESNGLPYYTMPFVDGESLRARLARGALPVAEAVGILRDGAKALAYAHERGVVHRDIKPDNVLLSGGSAVVTDFGIAKALSAARTDAVSHATHGTALTQMGSSIGTPAYMAPEQAAATLAVGLMARAAMMVVGLPEWVFPGALAVMAFGLPVILFTAFVHRTARRALTATPTLTPGGTPVPQSTMATIALRASPHVTWRRTWLGGMAAVSAFVALVAVFMVLRALGIGPAGSLLAAGKVTAREPFLVTDFRRQFHSAVGP